MGSIKKRQRRISPRKEYIMSVLKGYIRALGNDTVVKELKFTDLDPAEQEEIALFIAGVVNTLKSIKLGKDTWLPFEVQSCFVTERNGFNVDVEIATGIPTREIGDQNAFHKEAEKTMKNIAKSIKTPITRKLSNLESLIGVFKGAVPATLKDGGDYQMVGLEFSFAFARA